MVDVRTLLTSHEARLTFFGVVCAVVLGSVVLWLYLVIPIKGTASATLVQSDRSQRAVSITLSTMAWEGYRFRSAERSFIVAAVPSPTNDRVAYVTRTKDKVMRVSVADGDGDGGVEVTSGETGIPSWSPDGGSIAVSRVPDGVTETGVPENWSVVRALPRGDSLEVGRGYRPFPSPNQRTFALTSDGIALLSYSDTEPLLVIASPVPVPLTTPFAVSLDGMRVAWAAPADKSLQVFENVNGYFIPLLLKTDVHPDSLAFSPDGDYLLVSKNTEATSTLSIVRISDGRTRSVGEIGGLVKLHAWLYE
jgi:WD40 repeat protein